MATIHPTAIVAETAKLGEGVEIGPYCVIGGDVTLGARTRLMAHVSIDGATSLGEECLVAPFASLGQPPQHLGHKGERTELKIGARNQIREHVTMNTGTVMGRGVTEIGDDCLFMVGAHVGHDCVVGNHVIFANNATLGGHVQIGNNVFLGGLCAIHQNARIGSYAIVGGMAGLEGDLIPYGSVMGNRAYLAGLNIVGMKRRGMTKEQMHTLRRAFRELFEGADAFKDRLARVETDYADTKEVQDIVRFLKGESKRPLCTPPQKRGGAPSA